MPANKTLIFIPGRVAKGGVNRDEERDERPPAPQGSGVTQEGTIKFKHICPKCRGKNYGTTCVGYLHAFFDDNQIECSCGWKGCGSEMLLEFTDLFRGDVVICKGLEYTGPMFGRKVGDA